MGLKYTLQRMFLLLVTCFLMTFIYRVFVSILADWKQMRTINSPVGGNLPQVIQPDIRLHVDGLELQNQQFVPPLLDAPNNFDEKVKIDGANKDVVPTAAAIPTSDDIFANIPGPETSDVEKHHVALLKVHKCGSSTVQNIFLRFVDSRNLTMVFGHTATHPLTETRYPNMISYANSLTGTNMVPPPPGKHYDVLCCHVIYNETQFRRYMPHDTVYIGIVRDPFKRLESSMRYFNMYKNATASEFASDPLKYEKRVPSMGNNRMAFEFGFPLDMFPTLANPVPDKDRVHSYLINIYNQFDLILINERMEESLVYMKRLLRWKLEDIIFVKQLVGKYESRRFSEEDKLKLNSFMYLDISLYNFAAEQFESKFKTLGQDGIDEVSFYKDILVKVGSFCQNNTMESMIIAESKWSDQITVTPDKCRLYSLFEIKFVQDLRQKTYGTKTN